MNKPIAIMFVGLTHSGKTTVAKRLSEKLGCPVLDIDATDSVTKSVTHIVSELSKIGMKST